jgi:type I restriction enzyme, S subunit
VIRPLANIIPEYIYRFLAQDCVRRTAKEDFTGTAGQARVPTSFIEELEVPLAPLPEQRRIVAKLEKLLGQVDTCQQRLAKIPTLLKRFRQSVLAAACCGRLTADWREENPRPAGEGASESDLEGLPDSWASGPFGDVIESSFYGPRFGAESYSEKGIPTIRTTDISFDGSIVLQGTPCVTLSKKELDKYGLQDGDIVVTRTGATIGKCAVYEDTIGPAIPGAYLIRFRFRRDVVVPKFALRFWMSPMGQKLLGGGSTAVAQPNVNATTISQFVIPLPPLPEQQEIVRRVESLFALADQIEARLAAAQRQVDALTPSLLARAFAGKLAPQDPADEPASALLDRIRSRSPDPKGRSK